jgi:hypothetical protein
VGITDFQQPNDSRKCQFHLPIRKPASYRLLQ